MRGFLKTCHFKEKLSGFTWQKFNILIIMVLISGMIPTEMMAQTPQKITVTGTVRDASGETVIGVNIRVKDTFEGTITDMDGKYSISTYPDAVLQFTFLGFKEVLLPVDGKTSIDVTLEEDVEGLEELVVVGYGEIKRANVLGSVVSLDAGELEDIPSTSLSNLFEGRMPGVAVSPAQPTGNPGAQTRIRIRGETTFGTAGGGAKEASPLYIVDGFQMTQDEFDVLDPSEIESFSVLKDASAAVYGSRGANGVILVKTKRGREGKLVVSYSGSVGLSDATQQTEMLSAYQQGKMINARYSDDPSVNLIGEEELEELKSLNYDWMDDLWQTALVSRHNINFNGGTERVRYNASATYNYNAGNFPEMDFGKYSYRFGIDANITDHLSATATLAFDSKDFKRPYISGAGINTMEGLFQTVLQAPKWTPAYIDGNPVYLENGNPFALFESGSYRQNVDKGSTTQVRLSYKIPWVEGLETSVNYSRREGHSYYKQYQIPYQLYQYERAGVVTYSDNLLQIRDIENNDRIAESYSYSQNYQLNVNLNYANTFGKHDVSAFATYEQIEGQGHGFGVVTENMLVPDLETQKGFDYQSAVADGSLNESGRIGAVGRVNYSYADKYLLESSVRYESDVRFSPSERDGVFPSVAVGWIMSEEEFWRENVSFIDFLKLRYSWGITGFASIGSYEYLLQYGISGNYLFGSGSASSGLDVSGKTDVVASGATWEKSRMQNAGIDMKLFNSKLSVALDVYHTFQYDILTQRTVTLPETSGIVAMPSENLGELKAWGYDMSIGYNGRAGRDFSYGVSGIFSFNTNRVLDRPTQYGSTDFRYPINQSTYYNNGEQGYVTKGIIRSQEQLDAINAEWNEKWGKDYTVFGTPATLGGLYFQDIARPGTGDEPEIVYEADGVVDDYDITYIQDVNDKLIWKNLLPTNISMNAKWKDVSMSMLWGMAYGQYNDIVDKLARTVPDEDENSPAFWSDYWSEDNPDAAYPTPYGDNATYNQYASTFWMRDVKYLRLRNLNISYNLPASLVSRWSMSSVRVFFVGTNLWTPISTFDYKEDAIARYNTYPLQRTFSFGLNVKF